MDWNKLFSFGGSFRFSFAVLGGMLLGDERRRILGEGLSQLGTPSFCQKNVLSS
jgi:hypothetical protein